MVKLSESIEIQIPEPVTDNWLVYIIQSTDNRLYAGITTDISRRWRQHCGDVKGGAKFFRGRKPARLVFVESGFNRSTATRREIEIKKMTRRQKQQLLEGGSNKRNQYGSFRGEQDPLPADDHCR